MKYAIATALGCLCFSISALARDAEQGRWTTFKTTHNSQGQIEHQIDRDSIRLEGPYKTFWTRMWITGAKQPLVFSANEQIFFWSQMFAVDCPHRRFGSHYLDSNEPHEIKARMTVQTMSWESLDKVPVVSRVICGDR
jgi:hypothetical protein